MIAALLLAAAGQLELASGAGTASARVAGPVKLELRAYAADLEVVVSDKPAVTLTVEGKPGLRVALFGSGDRIEAQFSGKRQLREGRARIELPRGSSVDLSSVSGAVVVRDLGGDVRVRGMSGRVEVSGALLADVETIDGPARISSSAGPLRVHTISGAISLDGANAAVQAEVETSSGAVSFRGPCGKGCHVDVDSVSGPLGFALDRASSFALDFDTHAGKLKDSLGLSKAQTEKRGEDEWREQRFGAGEGAIECETFSGDLTISAR